MMRLGLEATPWRTLEHIAGVHHVAMWAARGLKAAGAPIDLALVSAGAAGHDIGKFGCRPGERVPYLHYHYTDLWFSRRHMADIGYVAANHSVWDLELDYLSAESLALIYADFRVKQERGPDGREITRISTLEEAFDVILSKLDNVTSPQGAFVETVKGWQKERFYVTEPREGTWAATPKFKSGPPMRLTSCVKKGLD